MKLFHGTPLSRHELILKDKFIKHRDVERQFNDSNCITPTTDGFIYLTNNLAYAVYHAHKIAYQKREKYFVIYEIDVEETSLLPDIDNIKYEHFHLGLHPENISLSLSLEIGLSCAVNFDLAIPKEVKRHAILPTLITENRTPKRHKHLDIVKSLIPSRIPEVKDVEVLAQNIEWVQF